ncbi:response regulator transcription factor, partial [Staphylococcus aureus]|uniref:response regulator transcription factor n=1 Tax=Staphylococcus aureus TaxID=1280 RepID=UPI00133019C7
LQARLPPERGPAAEPSAAAPELPDLIVLDLMLPDGSGFEVMEDLARVGYAGLILVLSARKEETDKVSALRMGADDYVTKPFSLAELLARIEALLRRGAARRPARS